MRVEEAHLAVRSRRGARSESSRRTAFEIALEGRGYEVSRAGRELDLLSDSSGRELSSWQDERRWEIARFHAEANPAYRRLLGSELPRTWSDLPIVAKSAFQQPLESLLSKGLRRRELHVASTSGSSGHPFFFARDRYAHARSWALIRQRYAWHGISLRSRQARFYGIPLERVARFKETVKDRLMNRVRFPVFDLSDTVLQRFVRRFAHDRFDYIYGYTNSLVLFARYLHRSGTRLSSVCPSLRVCITTSEMCTTEDRALLQGAFGVPVLNEYGASETGIIAVENAERDWIVSQENLFLEVVDAADRPVGDGAGEILVTDLFNRAMPFIRYRIGDVGTLGVDRSGRQILRTLEGRTNDTIRLPSGRTAAGLTFYYISRSILEQAGVLREFVIRQTALDEFVFDVVSDAPLQDREIRSIEEKMVRYLEPGLRLRVNRVAAIDRPASGKRKHFFSELKDDGVRG